MFSLACYSIIIPILVIDCRLPQLVIPAKAGIQAFQLYYV